MDEVYIVDIMKGQSLQTWCIENSRQDLLEEWDYGKNSIKPEEITVGSSVKAWWICSKGHEWSARISHRANGVGCPYCANKKVLAGYNDLATLNPQLSSEWNYVKNNGLTNGKKEDISTPDKVTPVSGQKVWWKCSKGHEWQAQIDNRTKGHGCPYCSGTKTIKGKTDLLSVNQSLSKEWNYEKNGDIKPSDYSATSGKKVWWKCSKGHEWEATIYDRNSGKGCPFCSGRRIFPGYNDLETINPTLASEWDWEKNTMSPNTISPNSHEKAWWICSSCGYEWNAQIKSRNRGCGCPECGLNKAAKTRIANQIVEKGTLAQNDPELAKEWHPTKNGDMTPEKFPSSSVRKVWWLGACGHEFKASVYERLKGLGCPYCAKYNKRVLKGYNDLATINPVLAKEWNYEKNADLKNGSNRDVSTPDKVTAVSGLKVWWKCKKGHEWKAAISNRTNGNGCPFCSKAGTSVPEQGVAYYLEQICKVEQRIKIFGKEIDVYLPDYNIGIEYDGVFYHNADSSKKEKEKNRILSENGISLIRIKESTENKVEVGEPTIIKYSFDDMGKNYEWAIVELCKLLASNTGNDLFNSVIVDTRKDFIIIRQRVDLYNKENNLAVKYPELIKEWDYKKNGVLTPEMFTYGSKAIVWWKCPMGHEWKTAINHRTKRGDGCAICSQKKMLKGYNDFESWCLANDKGDILKEWDYSKNPSNPSSYSRQSTKRVWWKCANGHEWQTSVGHRADGHGCPYCNGGSKKRVENTDTGEIFDSMIEAARAYGMKKSNPISRCCLGEQKTAGGYHWKFVDL